MDESKKLNVELIKKSYSHRCNRYIYIYMVINGEFISIILLVPFFLFFYLLIININIKLHMEFFVVVILYNRFL